MENPATAAFAGRLPEMRGEFGDWQTGYDFACAVCRKLKDMGAAPEVILEPTCGLGNFIRAGLAIFDTITDIYGIEIYKPYLDELRRSLVVKENQRIHLYHEDIFAFDFSEIKKQLEGKNVLILGNPPWVTNSELGKNGSTNLPQKYNYRGTKGIEAITGKGNFDIAESICNLLIENFASNEGTRIALLVKNSVVKNILIHQRPQGYFISHVCQYAFDAKKEFDVSVSASLFSCTIGKEKTDICRYYDFYTGAFQKSYGWKNDRFVSDIEEYDKAAMIDGVSELVWRSGVKHDCSKVMELIVRSGRYENGFRETVDVEPVCIYPLIKSSDIGNGFSGEVRKYIVLPHRSLAEPNSAMKQRTPLTYAYFEKYGQLLDGRKSSIYKGKPRFCVFGLGDYSFKPYKVVVSSFYKNIIFSLVSPINGQSVMLDDTCYMLGFDNWAFAKITHHLLNSPVVMQFISALCFTDAKRVINCELLMRIDLSKVLEIIGDVTIEGVTASEIDAYRVFINGKELPGQNDLFEGQRLNAKDMPFQGQPSKEPAISTFPRAKALKKHLCDVQLSFDY